MRLLTNNQYKLLQLDTWQASTAWQVRCKQSYTESLCHRYWRSAELSPHRIARVELVLRQIVPSPSCPRPTCVVPEKGPLNVCVCVCVCVLLQYGSKLCMQRLSRRHCKSKSVRRLVLWRYSQPKLGHLQILIDICPPALGCSKAAVALWQIYESKGGCCQWERQTDGWAPYHCIDAAPHTMRAASVKNNFCRKRFFLGFWLIGETV